MNDDNYLAINEQGLAEVSPTASRDAQLAFIDTYRQIQGENTQQIADQTHALGSDLPAQLGGLHGPSEYMKSRYQTPQTNARVAALRTASQLSALNRLMQNDQSRWNDRYSQTYRSDRKRARSSGGSGSGTGSTGGSNLSNADINVNVVEGLTPQATGSLRSDEGVATRLFTGEYDDQGRPVYKDLDENGNIIAQYEGGKETIATNAPSLWDQNWAIAQQNLSNLWNAGWGRFAN